MSGEIHVLCSNGVCLCVSFNKFLAISCWGFRFRLSMLFWGTCSWKIQSKFQILFRYIVSTYMYKQHKISIDYKNSRYDICIAFCLFYNFWHCANFLRINLICIFITLVKHVIYYTMSLLHSRTVGYVLFISIRLIFAINFS